MGNFLPDFSSRHLGPDKKEIDQMLKTLGLASLEELIDRTVPAEIRLTKEISLPARLSEQEALTELRKLADKNELWRSYIGQGYYGTILPAVIQRNILENPAWYTHYTPYQAEISQGRLEALFVFQTMISDLTGFPISNASLLDEATAAAEAMALCYRVATGNRKRFLLVGQHFPQTVAVVKTRAFGLGIEVIETSLTDTYFDEEVFGLLVSYPDGDGKVNDYAELCKKAAAKNILVTCACDILALSMLKAPAEWGADMAVGSAQRFGVPMGFGGPHAGFMAVRGELAREMPGRMVGLAQDAQGARAFRLALQTREQHIRRERATSNICTAQVLLAILAAMYAVYHGPEGIKKIAERLYNIAQFIKERLVGLGFKENNSFVFDTLQITASGEQLAKIKAQAESKKINFRYSSAAIYISADETMTAEDIVAIIQCFGDDKIQVKDVLDGLATPIEMPVQFKRQSSYLTNEVFNSYHSETKVFRYLRQLQDKDISLANSMIALGSCTMKLNSSASMLALSWPQFAALHPFVPEKQARGYGELFSQLENYLAEITGMDCVSLQPNAGSQGEYAGLMLIRSYFIDRGERERTLCLIPASAHGTNPASASLAGLETVHVKCDIDGNIDVSDLGEKLRQYKEEVAAIMITYPSTHGVFEREIKKVCRMVHDAGGLVYLDGANMNAQVGYCRPGDFGADVCHLNLHKTFAIPHGGGGPGVGPIAAKKILAKYLPCHPLVKVGGEKSMGTVSAAPWGSASIMTIPWIYIRMMGREGLSQATAVAILNANYVAACLEKYFPVLYKGEKGLVAHECILDLRNFKKTVSVDVTDVAKRLMDYGFHAPTVSFPVVETLMVEPTESESREELDRFVAAMIAIRGEIADIESGRVKAADSPLKNAPHPAHLLIVNEFPFPYSREQAAYPLPYLKHKTYFPPVSRIDPVSSDRHFCCTLVQVTNP
ncbi:MAG: aminomethyl-transferring glycine dehydrogenase [Deltaproteobacteria bacterium]|nr:aminomethyl-transferring glycine dehydrogenase [Deltaproteobacteria bacterium]